MSNVPKAETRPRVLLVSMKVGERFYNIAPPLGLYQLHNYLRHHSITCDILDRELSDEAPFIESVEHGLYDIVGMSVSHTNMAEELDLLWKFRSAAAKNSLPTLFVAGGQEATLNWQQWLGAGVDLIVLGYGEKRLLSLAQCYTNLLNNQTEKPTLEELTAAQDGLAFKNQNNELVYRPSCRLSQDEFEELFFERPQKNSVPFQDYWDIVRENSANNSMGASEFIVENVRLYTTSHCARRCGFCNSQSFIGESTVEKEGLLTFKKELAFSKGITSPVYLSAEQCKTLVLHYVKTYGARSFLFSDDDFPIGNVPGLKRIQKFCELMIDCKQEGVIDQSIRFSCQARIADFLLLEKKNGQKCKVPNWKLLSSMADAGFNSIGLGVETFSDRLLRAPSVNKIGITSENCRTVIDAMLEVGLAPQFNLILGIPETTADELAETLEIAANYLCKNCDIAITPRMLAMPGSPIYNADLFEVVHTEWENPLSGAQVAIADYFIPKDSLVAKAINRLDDARRAELDRIVEEQGWQGRIVHKRIVGLSTLIAMARLIEREDLANRFNQTLEQIIDGEAEAANRLLQK